MEQQVDQGRECRGTPRRRDGKHRSRLRGERIEGTGAVLEYPSATGCYLLGAMAFPRKKIFCLEKSLARKN